MDTERRSHPKDAVNWKCPLCDKAFRSEKEKDIHMANTCKFQAPMDVEDRAARRSSASNIPRQKREPGIKQGAKNRIIYNGLRNNLFECEFSSLASQSATNLSLSSKVLVSLTWYKLERYTGEREISFYDKSGEMFKLSFSADKKGSSNGCFKGDCIMEVGEHEGSLGVADLGVFDVLPFKVLMREQKQIVLIRIVGEKELYNGSREVGQSSAISHTSEDKRVAKEQLKQAETTIQLLTRKNEDTQRECRDTITKLEARIAEKEKEMSHRNEELRNTQDELGRYSERSQAIMDRHGADKSNHEESLLLIEEYKKRVSKQRETISRLEQEADSNKATQSQSDSENNALQIEINDVRCERNALGSERENLFSEIRQIKDEKDKFMCALTAQTQTINQSAKQSKGEFNERIVALEGESRKKDEAIQQLSSVQSEDLLRKCSLLEKELKQLKSNMSIGDVYESNNTTIREKERMIKEILRNNEELEQRNQDLEMDLSLEKSECEEGKAKVIDLRKEIKILEKNLSFRETESGYMRQENIKMKSELNKARRVLVSNFNSQNEAEEVGHDDDEESMFSVSQSLGHEFKRENIGGYNIELQPGERRQKMELDERVSQMNSYIKELKQKLVLCSEENKSLRKQLLTSERELDMMKHKLVQTEENLSATQTYLDEEQFKLKLKEKGANKIDIPDTASGTTKTPIARPTNQTKYKYTTVFFAKKKTQAYSLNQVGNPKDHLEGIVLCRYSTQKNPYTDYVAGTLKTIIPPKFRGDKSMAGIEFLDPLGNCDGEYNLKRYFKSKRMHAAFLSLDQIYIACEDAK